MTGSPGNPLQAAEPQRNATVHASAGTGKTWLLVTRILRLLLAGARPDSILAVTFTRKAAAEMQQRVSERLHALMCADDERLDAQLQACGITPQTAIRTRARQLYEENLFAPHALRATTFHAFCQELLQRFPLEAGVSPGFELIEATGLLQQQALDALVYESSDTTRAINRSLDRLIEGCNGLANTRAALLNFLAHRSDWWACVEDQADPLEFTTQSLQQLLDIDLHDEPLAGFPNDIQREQVNSFSGLLARNATKRDLDYASQLADALEQQLDGEAFYAAIWSTFITGGGSVRVRKDGKALRKRLGDTHADRYLDLHRQLSELLLQLADRLRRYNTCHNSIAWISAGMRLLDHYQRIKQEQRLLDFADLEWQACALLNRSEHASWVQYKLDTRIDHLLVDEFQDTNPTQWRLLKPLLEELASGNDERARSVFLVGDKKQSIYSFRRANPALFGEASAWLHDKLQAEAYPLDASRRSAQAIIDCVNTVFMQEPLQQRLAEYNEHSTWLPQLYGHVELLPLATTVPHAEEQPSSPPGLRNPLHAPRVLHEDQRYADEAQLIAATIASLINRQTAVTRDTVTRALQYSDIIILLRQRTHVSAYEQALRTAHIPYLSDSKGALLDNLEIRDLECLLNILISPYDNLALAQVLRSPIFNLDSEQLLPLAAFEHGSWYERLGQLAGQQPYQYIHAQLEDWRALAGQIPVHDLLDRIFHQAEIERRYLAAWPEALRPRVSASLTRFIELALEVDNGRYPSLPRFLEQLQRLRQSERDQPDEHAPVEAHAQRVRIMTIHGAKGLEAPVVFLADSASLPSDHTAYAALVDWPEQADRPAHMLLVGKKEQQDQVSRALLDKQATADQREDANLLYVALTRARQYLFISGNAREQAKDNSWYGLIQSALTDWEQNSAGNRCHTSGAQPPLDNVPQRPVVDSQPDAGLSRPLQIKTTERLIAPSRALQSDDQAHGTGDGTGRERGNAIHYMLDQLGSARLPATATVPVAAATALQRDQDDAQLQDWWREAVATVQHEDLATIFNAAHFERACNEVPIQYLDGEILVYGIIDRLVIGTDGIHIIDYKTHRHACADTVDELARQYRGQLRLYADGVARLWPGRTVRQSLLFTACGLLVSVNNG